MELKRGTKRLVISIILIDLFLCFCLCVIYGPWQGFRTFWITTSMTTMNHRYLAHMLYNEETINRVMSNNTLLEVNETSNPGLIYTTPISENSLYDDEYEKQILKRDESIPYKVIDVSGTGYKGFLVAVYDSSKVKLALSNHLGKKGDKINAIAKNNNALVAINASGFIDPEGHGNGGEATGSIVNNGNIIWSGGAPGFNSGVIGFTNDNQLILTKDSMDIAIDKYNLRDAVEFGPFLIINGKPASIKGNGGYGIQPRTAIAQRQDGIVLFLVIDGRRPGYSLGASMNDMIKILTDYKAFNASNLDGGSSTGLYVNGDIINKPTSKASDGLRYLPNAWIVTK